MSDKSINSLLGSLATKELPASGRSQTVNNSISTNHDEDSFHAKLLNSMENNQTSDRQTDTDIPSESNSMKNTQTTDKRTASNNSTNSNSVKITQTSDEQIINNIPTEPNLMKNTQPPDEQTATDIPSELANAKTADDINHIVKLLSIGLQTSQTTNTDGNQAQLSREVNQNVKANEFANVIITQIERF